MQTSRHYTLQVFKHPGPGEGLAQEQIVEKLGAVAGAAIGRQIQGLFGFGFLQIAGSDLLLTLLDQSMIFACICPSRNRAVKQDQGKKAQPCQSSAPPDPQRAGVFIGTGGEIDVNAHIRKAGPPLRRPFSISESNLCSRAVATGRPGR